MKINGSPQQLDHLAKPPVAQSVEPGKDENFGNMLMDVIKELNASQNDAKQLQEDFMANRPVETHELMIAMERASTAMQLTMQVRNKALEAYQEISRMQV
jgi:flagellar hook-basal body complex protein FliE